MEYPQPDLTQPLNQIARLAERAVDIEAIATASAIFGDTQLLVTGLKAYFENTSAQAELSRGACREMLKHGLTFDQTQQILDRAWDGHKFEIV
jgi:hypothetical protein